MILITCGAGFIGTHLAKRLREEGHEVRVLDIVDPKVAIAGVKYAKGDIRNLDQVTKLLDGVTAIFHFAAIVSVQICQNEPARGYDTNLNATLNLLSLISNRKRNFPKVFFASSSAVYGRNGEDGHALNESEPLNAPLSFYAAQKLAAEQALRLYSDQLGFPALSFRFFNVYGPGQGDDSPYSGVISVFRRRILEGKSLVIYGKGERTRDFVSVYDVVKACTLSLSKEIEDLRGQSINLGTGIPTTILELCEQMINAACLSLPVEFLPARDGDVAHSKAAIEKANSFLGWVPERTIKNELPALLGVSI